MSYAELLSDARQAYMDAVFDALDQVIKVASADARRRALMRAVPDFRHLSDAEIEALSDEVLDPSQPARLAAHDQYAATVRDLVAAHERATAALNHYRRLDSSWVKS